MKEKLCMSDVRFEPHRRACKAAAALVLLLPIGILAGCSGKTGTAQFVNAPTAVATPIGYKATSAAGQSPVVITVRAGADVQLTGEDSDGGNISITRFTWNQTDAAPIPAVALIYRNSSTVSFTAPSVAKATTLNLQLAVTNALGKTGTTVVQVNVMPANDPDHFISLLAIPTHFKAALSLAKAGANVGDAISLSGDAPVCVTLTPTLTYLSRGAASHSVPLPVQSVDAKWSASIGATAGFPTGAQGFLAFKNPVVSFELPARNDETVFAQFNQPGATSTDIANQLVASDIDTAFVPMTVAAAWGSCASPGSAPAGLDLVLQLEDQFGTAVGAPVTASGGGEAKVDTSPAPQPNPLTPSGSAQLTAEDFLRVAGIGGVAESPNTEVETRESAAAYYAAIDPGSAKTTLSAWLTANCFDANAADYGAGESGYSVAHATYTNNFDLGFGRDMYFANCTGAKTPGNMAAVVINYPSLEAAANKLGAFLAVAMEYTPAAGSTGPCFTNIANAATNTGKCFTKFFVFAPDDRTGQFNRVLSANFDRRGQKYVPGACTVCHGGTPQFTPGQPYAHAGNIDAAFMPWDLGSLLFSDTDPAFACNVYASSPTCLSVDPTKFTQSAQAPNIQQLNALTWRTYQFPETVVTVTPPSSINRYQAPIDLLTKWYGGDPGASSAHAFDDSTTPSDWQIAGQTAPGDLYHEVFAHYCRSCHTQNDVPKEQFATYAAFEAFLATTSTSTLPVSSTNIQQLVFHNAQMPLSRLTADRFWVNYDGGQSAAQTLAAYINTVAAAPPTGQSVGSVAVDSGGNVVPPGAPQFALSSSNPSNPTVLTTGGVLALTRFQGASIDALTQSIFLSTYQWSLCAVGPPAAPGDGCPGTAFELAGTPEAAASASTGASQPGFATVAPGVYYLTLTAQSAVNGATPVSATYKVSVAKQVPALTPGAATGSCPITRANFDGTAINFDVTSCLTAPGDAGPTGYTLQVSADGANYFSCINSTGCANTVPSALWSASVSSGQTLVNGQNTFVPTITFGFRGGATADATVYYRWCDFDAVCVASNADVALSHLAALPAALVGYWDPASANSNYSSLVVTFSTPSGGLQILNATPSASSGSMAFSLGGDLIMDPASDTYSFSLSTPSDGGSFNGSATSLTVTGTPTDVLTLASALSYMPGTGTCVGLDVNGAAITNSLNPSCTATDNGVSFNYALTDTTQATSSSTSGSVNIRAIASFYQSSSANSVYSSLSTAEGGFTCSNAGCHATAGNVWFMGANAQGTYTNITGATGTTGALIVPGNPSQSAFYTVPCTGKDPANASINMNGATYSKTSAACLIIYQWILEGGQFD